MIIQILITSLICFGIYNATRVKFSLIENKYTQKEILWFIKYYADQYLTEWLRKPLYDCPCCMASFWSIVTSLYFGFSIELLIIIPAVSGLNYICSRMFPYSE